MKNRILLMGFGTVGQGLTEILLEKRDELREKYGFEFDITGVCDQRGNVFNADGLDLQQMLTEARSGQNFSKDLVDWDNLEMIRKGNASVMCEMTFTDLETGGAALEHCRVALEEGLHVTTTNKGPAALKYGELNDLAQSRDVKFLIEGTVMSGTPVLNLVEGPLNGCKVTKVRGIVNGTTNFILSEMEKGMSYDEALKTAQKLGYAEANPAGDVEGHDARGKITILANVVMNARLHIKQVPCKGITQITSEDIELARKNNARWKLIGSAEILSDGSVHASVAPEMIDLSHPLAGVMGATNALTFTTDLLGDVTIVGKGAGRRETGFALLTDLLRIHRTRR